MHELSQAIPPRDVVKAFALTPLYSYRLGMHDCLVAALGNYSYGAFAVVTVKKAEKQKSLVQRNVPLELGITGKFHCRLMTK